MSREDVSLGNLKSRLTAYVVELKSNVPKTIASDFLNLVKDMTPIGKPSLWQNPPHYDYVPGALKQSWKLIDPYRVANDRPYVMRIEYGWSGQAPEGMIRRALTILNLKYSEKHYGMVQIPKGVVRVNLNTETRVKPRRAR